MVKRIESAFVPLFIYNNRSGKDAKLLKKYKEPSWNYPVVRFFAADGSELIPRKDRVYSLKGIGERIDLALKKAGDP